MMQRGNRAAARMTPTQVLEIRERYAAGESQGALARRFGLNINTVGKIVRRESWSWLAAGATPQEASDPPPVIHHARPFAEVRGTLERLLQVQEETNRGQGQSPLDEE